MFHAIVADGIHDKSYTLPCRFSEDVTEPHSNYTCKCHAITSYSQTALVPGGFAKRPDMPPDLLHSFYSVCWLSLCEEPGIGEMDVALGITTRTAQEIRLKSGNRHQRAKNTELLNT